VTPRTYSRLTRSALWALTVIVVSGGAVRLTGSGLGCSDWPRCEEDRFVADLEYHALVEFVNRLLTGAVSIAVILAVVGSLRRRPRRPDLVWWSFGLVAGVVGQIVLGGVLVLTDLDPRFTMGHFLLSMVLIWNAVVLDHRARDFDPTNAGGLVPPGQQMMIRGISVVGAALLVTGTIVTGAGPHSGDVDAERLPFLVREVTRIHSLVAIGLLVLVVMTWRMLGSSYASGAVRGRAGRVALLLVAQGTVGYVQYFTGVPVVLVGIHLLLASLTWIEIVGLHVAAVAPTAAERTVDDRALVGS
jgi:cytochrome c oxidase assembly protein subunit 15